MTDTTSFRDAIGRAISQDEPYYSEADGLDLGDEMKASAVLAMPEMQAIRSAVREFVSVYHHHGPRQVLAAAPFRLPDSVIDWVLADEHR